MAELEEMVSNSSTATMYYFLLYRSLLVSLIYISTNNEPRTKLSLKKTVSYNFPFFSSPWRLVLCFRYNSCQFWRVFLYSYVHRLVPFVRLICYCSFRGKRILQISQFSCCRLLPKKTVAVPFTVTLNVFITFRGQFRVMFNDWLYLYIYTYILALFLPTVRYLSFRAFFGMCVRFYIYIYVLFC